MKLVDLHAMWTSDLILSVLGIQLFIFEVSRKFPLTTYKANFQAMVAWMERFLLAKLSKDKDRRKVHPVSPESI